MNSPVVFIGDLSKSDAELLEQLARVSTRILEFGMGGSTQIFAQCCNAVTSLDTSQKWLDRTKKILEQLPAHPTKLLRYGNKGTVSGSFDLIFDDGHPMWRLDFARWAWPLLRTGGKLLVHDTRVRHINVVCELLHEFKNEIESVEVNKDGSNITVITKKPREPYSNWNKDEEKEEWECGNWDRSENKLPRNWIMIRRRRLRG